MAEEDEEWENEDEFVGFVADEILDWIHEEYEESEESQGELSGEEEPPAAEIPASFFSDVDVNISIEYEELLLSETQFDYTQPLSFFLGNVVDELRWMIVGHVQYTHRFYLLKRHFQMMLWVNNDANPRWERISHDDTMEEALNKHQMGLRLGSYRFRIALNHGQNPSSCGRA